MSTFDFTNVENVNLTYTSIRNFVTNLWNVFGDPSSKKHPFTLYNALMLRTTLDEIENIQCFIKGYIDFFGRSNNLEHVKNLKELKMIDRTECIFYQDNKKICIPIGEFIESLTDEEVENVRLSLLMISVRFFDVGEVVIEELQGASVSDEKKDMMSMIGNVVSGFLKNENGTEKNVLNETFSDVSDIVENIDFSKNDLQENINSILNNDKFNNIIKNIGKMMSNIDEKKIGDVMEKFSEHPKIEEIKKQMFEGQNEQVRESQKEQEQELEPEVNSDEEAMKEVPVPKISRQQRRHSKSVSIKKLNN